MSSVGARIGRARALRIAKQTYRIPYKPGLSYGVAFVVRGTPPGGLIDLKVILTSSTPCVLKTNGEVVYHNDSILRVRIGELRHIGAAIVSGEQNHCRETPEPGTETFELFYGDDKLAEKTFELFRE